MAITGPTKPLRRSLTFRLRILNESGPPPTQPVAARFGRLFGQWTVDKPSGGFSGSSFISTSISFISTSIKTVGRVTDVVIGQGHSGREACLSNHPSGQRVTLVVH